MQAQRLELKDFRNYREEALEFGPGLNILWGDNAQGKTNVLEAVYLFSMGKANRARRDSELIRTGQEQARLTLQFLDGDRQVQAGIHLFKNRRKLITVNETPVRRSSELVGRFRVVYFGPEYLSLVKEGPKQRRRNTDILISQLKPRYFSALSGLKRLVESKNALLKMERPNLTMLGILNEKLADFSGEIMACRAAYIRRMGEIASRIQREISGGSEALEVRYLSCLGEVDGLEPQEIKTRLLARLEESQRRELELRESVIGPHREDVGYSINGQEARSFASQGQQKTVVLVQKLAEVELMREETGELPVLLLDDIMSELDQKRRSFILGHIQNTQILLTCTEVDGFAVSGGTRLFRIKAGTAAAEETGK